MPDQSTWLTVNESAIRGEISVINCGGISVDIHENVLLAAKGR